MILLTGTSSRSLYPKILYASRTHSQLAQVIRELNKTTYKDIKSVTLASRDLLCINDKVMKENNSHVKSLMCRNLISKHQCPFYNFYESMFLFFFLSFSLPFFLFSFACLIRYWKFFNIGKASK
ncbi:unnamed protein product [Onchocerca flexuosa]|uniref:DEAD_2 domain-containing protein n=1 Tax=Onchocerca flexuosa TaxID=387005 RepID=A0A183HWR3_9BILA|nr:unnamed protein product [Onchocerca flexuosa]